MTTSLLVFFGGGQEKAEYRKRYPGGAALVARAWNDGPCTAHRIGIENDTRQTREGGGKGQ